MQAFLFACYSHFPKSSYVLESLPYGLYLSLTPSLPPSLISSLPPLSIHPCLPPSATPNPPSPCMCYSNIAARTQCFSMPQDRTEHYSMAELIYWLRATVGPTLGGSVGVLIGHRGIGACISVSSG